VSASTRATPSGAPALVALLGIALFVGTVVAWFASAHPDGLEWSVARVYGSEELPERENPVAAKLESVQERTAFLPDYGFASAEEDAAEEEEGGWPAVSAGTSVSGLVGSMITAGLVFAFGLVLMLFRKRDAKAGSG